VTNNLYREFQEAQTGGMRESSISLFFVTRQVGDRKSIAKSLFQQILPVSPCSSRFWLDSPIPLARKPFAMRILQKVMKKKLKAYPLMRDVQASASGAKEPNVAKAQTQPIITIDNES
jgi:hypothetical protein